MKKRFGTIIYIILPWIMSSAFFVHAAQEEWHGSQVSNVLDNDLVISSNVHLPQGGTSIEARNSDVRVTLEKDIIVKANNNGHSELYLIAGAGHTITFRLDNDLQFQGSSNNANTPLLIVQSGPGNVIWELEGSHTVAFTSASGTGGTQYYLLISASDEYASLPEALFKRIVNRGASDENVTIEIGRRSLFGYLSNAPVGFDQGQASFVFDPSNRGEGLMELLIQDRGAVIVSPRRVKNAGLNIILSDIAKSELAGGQALFEVINSKGAASAASLFVVNHNKTLSELLFDPFLNLKTRSANTNYKGSFTGKQYGFVVGSNGILRIEDNANVNYVGLSLNVEPATGLTPDACGLLPSSELIKTRNASALTFDQSHNPIAQTPQLSFGGPAALFLRSGVDAAGDFRALSKSHPFTLPNDMLETVGVGNYVLDIEGDANVVGELENGAQQAKIELLSLEVAPTGGSLFVNTTETNFPIRTFAQNNLSELYRYNSGSFLINGHLNLENVSLVHTNENAPVIANDDVNSVPTYIGGETFSLLPVDGLSDLEKILMRPKITFVNARLLLHSSAGVTGVDLLVPNAVQAGDVGVKNHNEFIFAYNGFAVDNGGGRSLVLGTDIGSKAADGFTVISGDAHLDIMQTSDIFDLNVDPLDPQGDQTLALKTLANDSSIESAIGNNTITGQFGTQTIFLGNNSNISIGTNSNVTGFFEDTHPTLRVAGNFFAFSSAGGVLKSPSTSVRTGTGGIFVDLNGTFAVDPLFDVTINTTIARNYNGIIDIPLSSAVFNSLVGVTNSNVDLTNPNNLILVASGEQFSDYTIDWATVKKDFIIDGTGSFIPYSTSANTLATSPAVTQANISNIPVIEGSVGQLQIIGSTLASPATIKIKGGTVGELVFINSNDSGNAPVAIIVLEDGGTLGVGSASRNADSIFSTAQLGHNGITVITNTGGGRVILNENVSIQGVSPFLFGPDAQGDTLHIVSANDQALLVTNSSVLDLRGVTASNVVEFGQEAQLIMNPASKIVFGGGTLRFADNAKLTFEPSGQAIRFFDSIPFGPINNTLSPEFSVAANMPHNEFAPLINVANGLNNTDAFRVSLIGKGIMEVTGNAQVSLPKNAFVGVETLKQVIDAPSNLVAEIPVTDLTLLVTQSGRISVGNENFELGGVLQVGNVEDLGANHNISFALNLNGTDAIVEVGAQGVLGLNVGVVKGIKNNVSDMLVNTLFNVSSINFNIDKGALNISRIWDTDDARANIVLIGDNANNKPQFNLKYSVFGTQVDTIVDLRSQDAVVQGGSPLAYILQAPQIGQTAGALAPIVRADDNQVVVGQNPDGTPIIRARYLAGMLASTFLQDNTQDELLKNGLDFFNQLKTQEAFLGFTSSHNKANAASNGQDFRESLDSVRLGTVSQDAIIRSNQEDIFSGSGDNSVDARQNAVEIGAVFVSFDELTNTIQTVAQIPV